MPTNPDARHDEDGFPADRPLDALKADHDLVRQLFDRYMNTRGMDEKKDIGTQILTRLEMHMAMEEGAFYPGVREVDDTLIDQCEAEHLAAKDVMDQLRGMDEGDPQIDQVVQRLAEHIRTHLETEEQQLFPKLQQSKLDLVTIGYAMRAYSESWRTSGGSAAQQPGMRR